ncbi:phosphatidylcholine synthase, partial [Francisella tularensis subsp. holarctica]|nr:phosphatidylcholine synthase [Francisella tularensis subsp. holarctica]
FTMLAAIATFLAVLLYPLITPTPLVTIILVFTIFYILFSLKLNIKPVKS